MQRQSDVILPSAFDEGQPGEREAPQKERGRVKYQILQIIGRHIRFVRNEQSYKCIQVCIFN